MPRVLITRIAPAVLLTLILGAGCSPTNTSLQVPATAERQTAASESATDVANDTGDYTPTYTVEACDLITSDEAEFLLGGVLMPSYTEEGGDPAKKYCRYTTSKESDVSRMMELSVFESENLRNSLYEWPADEYFSRFKAGHRNVPEEFEQLQGMGDDAYIWGDTVKVLKMPFIIWISVRGFPEDEDKIKSIEAAKHAIERLP